MKSVYTKQELSILDAVDLLSSMAEIDVTLSLEGGFPEPNSLHPLRWVDPNYASYQEEVIKDVFQSVKKYLEQIYEKDSARLKDPQIQYGVRALMSLLGEALEKVNKFTPLFKKEGSSFDVKEYRDLQEFYVSAIKPYLPAEEDIEENWEEQLGIQADKLLEIQKKGVYDLEDVRKDRNYELFFLRKEDGKPFYDYDMIRRLKLLYDFDQIVKDSEGEDFFRKCAILQDREFQGMALGILKGLSHLMHEFYREALKHKGNTLVASMSKALMALMLCANPRNRLEESVSEKGAADYFEDFHHYLRQALSSPEYRQMEGAKPQSANAFQMAVYLLVHKLCSSYFLNVNSQKEIASLVRRIIQAGESLVEPADQKSSWWDTLSHEDAQIRAVFKQRPSGPVTKIVEAFIEYDIEKGWDPFSHKNVPIQIFGFSREGKEVSCLRMPVPLKQTSIQEASVVEEFKGFIKSLSMEDPPQSFLLVNLQDRTGWEEHARSLCIEEMDVQENNCFIFSLPKNTDFYWQKEPYAQLKDANLFIGQLKEQVEGGGQCGFYFPKNWKKEDLLGFVSLASREIHEHFFGKKTELSVEERRDFIEIFYFFLVLKCIDVLDPRWVSFSCKDGIDIGIAASAAFFSCLRLLISDLPWKDEEEDFLLWILYTPALFLRKRAIQSEHLYRSISAIIAFQNRLQGQRKKVIGLCHTLGIEPFWDSIAIKKPD